MYNICRLRQHVRMVSPVHQLDQEKEKGAMEEKEEEKQRRMKPHLCNGVAEANGPVMLAKTSGQGFCQSQMVKGAAKVKRARALPKSNAQGC